MEVVEYNPEEFNRRVANEIYLDWKSLCHNKPEVYIGLSGGNTPLPILEILANKELPWRKFSFFLVDERTVNPRNHRSNYGNLAKHFFNKIDSKVFPVFNNLDDIDSSIREYSSRINKIVKIKNNNLPVFHRILLGMGNDGHIASLFKGTTALSETNKTVVKNFVSKLNEYRITFTFPIINNSERNTLIFKGIDKKRIFDTGNIDYPVFNIKLDRVFYSK